MVRRSISMQRLKAILFLAVVAVLFASSLYSGLQEPPSVKIGGITPRMGFKKVCVRGILESDAFTLQDRSVCCMLVDGTGSIPVFVDPEHDAAGLAAGTPVVITGHLNAAVDGRAGIRVDAGGAIRESELLAPVRIRGCVADVYETPPGSRRPGRIILNRAEGRIELVHWYPLELKVDPGDELEAEGALEVYRGRLQLKVRRAGDIRLHHDG